MLAAAAEAAGHQQHPAGALYVVATPIGNLADFSLRAIHVLALVDAVACEDTRVSGGLLRHLGLDKPLIALHEHNEREASAKVLARLAAGERVAYVTDFLTRAREKGFAVPDILFKSALDRIRNSVVNANEPEKDGGRDLAYGLYVLARNGAAPIGDLRYLADTKLGNLATPIAKSQLAAARPGRP